MIRLYDYQIDAVKRMRNGCVLCGTGGSGKSLTAVAYYYVSNGGSIRSLSNGTYIPAKQLPDLYIITTARKRDTYEWDKELSPFLLSREKEYNHYKNNVVVDSWNNIGKYTSVNGAFFIFDEQRVVGNGVWVKSFLTIAKRNKWVLLSATPGDTWSDYIPLFVANGFYKNRTQFVREHIIYSRYAKFPQIDRYVGEQYLEKLRDSILIDMDFLRPTVRHDEEIFATYDSMKYREIMKTRWDPWKSEPIENAAGLCYCLRKLVNSDESRQIVILELCERHPKVIIFYSFDYELEILKGLAYLPGTKVAEWNGHKHEPIPDGNRWVYLVNYAAGAEGWNCTLTDTVIFYSQNYSYKTMEQAAWRIDRVNTPFKDLYCYHIKSRSKIDLAISRAIEEKRTFNERKFVKW